MEMRQYRDTGVEVSLLGMGCMRLPKLDPEKPDIDYVKAQEIIDYAYSHGVNTLIPPTSTTAASRRALSDRP